MALLPDSRLAEAIIPTSPEQKVDFDTVVFAAVEKPSEYSSAELEYIAFSGDTDEVAVEAAARVADSIVKFLLRRGQLELVPGETESDAIQRVARHAAAAGLLAGLLFAEEKKPKR